MFSEQIPEGKVALHVGAEGVTSFAALSIPDSGANTS